MNDLWLRPKIVKYTRLAGGLTLLLAGVFGCIWIPTGTRYELTCKVRIHLGMTLTEVESILGPGKKCSWPPTEWGIGPVVKGEQFFVWEDRGMEFWVGLRDGRVCGTWFWAPSL
jgi:hypothetical protein